MVHWAEYYSLQRLRNVIYHFIPLNYNTTEGKRGKPDTVSRASRVKAVLDFAEASNRFQSRAPLGQHNNVSGNLSTIGLDEVSKFVFGKWDITHVHTRIYRVAVACISLCELDPRLRDVYKS